MVERSRADNPAGSSGIFDIPCPLLKNRGGFARVRLEYVPHGENYFSWRGRHRNRLEIFGRSGRQAIAGGLWLISGFERARAAELEQAAGRSFGGRLGC